MTTEMLIDMEQFAKEIGLSKESIYFYRLRHKRTNFKEPSWFVEGKVNPREFHKKMGVYKRVQLYNTNKLYWVFEAIGIKDTQLAEIMAKKSLFKSVSSWKQFLSRGMFVDGTRYEEMTNPTMHTEFLRYGTRLIYEMIKDGKIDKNMKSEVFL